MAKDKKASKAAAKTGGGWWDGMKSEFRKIIWPTKEDVTKQTIAVTAVTIVLAIIIALIDAVAKFGIDFLINISL